MSNLFEKTFGIPKPKCCSSGDCCKGVSPSTPYHQLLRRAAEGDEFARNFFAIMIPYTTHDAARAVVPGVVTKTLEACLKLDDFPNNEADVVFYHCRYLQDDNRCGVHEDRPQFCRDYPDSPFVVMAPNCAYLPWAKACKKEYARLKDNIEQLKTEKLLLEEALDGETTLPQKPDQAFNPAAEEVMTEANSWSNLSWSSLSLTPLFLSSPMQSYWLRGTPAI